MHIEKNALGSFNCAVKGRQHCGTLFYSGIRADTAFLFVFQRYAQMLWA